MINENNINDRNESRKIHARYTKVSLKFKRLIAKSFSKLNIKC